MHLDKGCMEIINAHCHNKTLRDQNSEHGNAEEQVWTPAPIDLGAAGLCYHGKSAAVLVSWSRTAVNRQTADNGYDRVPHF